LRHRYQKNVLTCAVCPRVPLRSSPPGAYGVHACGCAPNVAAPLCAWCDHGFHADQAHPRMMSRCERCASPGKIAVSRWLTASLGMGVFAAVILTVAPESAIKLIIAVQYVAVLSLDAAAPGHSVIGVLSLDEHSIKLRCIFPSSLVGR
jgi:hypothetical protein